MASTRKKLGVLFISDDIGVVYYLSNIIKSLNSLNVIEKPFLRIYYIDNCEKYLNLIEYEYKELVKFTLHKSLFKYMKSVLIGENFVLNSLPNVEDLDGIFPFNDFPGSKPVVNPLLISWIPDFQHKFFPQFFTKKNLFLREKKFNSIIAKADGLILSSENAYTHLKQHYKVPQDLKITILRFVSMIKDHELTEFSHIIKKYNINNPFFLVSNQFYEHKNHIVVLKAIKLLKQENIKFQVIFSGKTEDYRNPAFFARLLQFIVKHELTEYVQIVGLIPREDQLSMLVNSLALIQPSKFEGWSTIIEDSKTLMHQVICSSLPVHKEQLNDFGFYFEPDSETELASLMKAFIEGTITRKNIPDTYNVRIETFAQTFLKSFCK
jgi:glycosyltransferase involved in cell wall biosynthesis